MKLDNLAVGDVVVQINGPYTGHNHTSGSASPTAKIQVWGTGHVKIQTNSVPMFVGGMTGNHEYVPNPANWADSTATDVKQADGIVSVTLTPSTTGPNWIQVVVVTADPNGNSRVAFGTFWT